jgi:hypothetical protein
VVKKVNRNNLGAFLAEQGEGERCVCHTRQESMEGAGNQCRPRWVVHVVANAKEM